MSDVLQSVAELRLKQNTALVDSKLCKTSYLEATEDPEEVRVRSVQKLLSDKNKEKQSQNSPMTTDFHSECKTKSVDASRQNQSFGGFKKGFLLSSAKQPASKKSKQLSSAKAEALEEIKKSNHSKAKDPLVFDEIQETLASQMPLLKSKDWITEDLLSKIEKNPKLMKQLEDPRFSQALTAFQANPQKALLAVQNDPEVKEFIQEFCGLLGEHFTTLGEEETKKKDQMKKPIDTLEASSTRKLLPGSKDNASQMEEEKFQKIISDPEIKEILNDKRIQHLIHTLKENPAIAQRTLSELGPEYHGKIQRLIEAGLLGVARK